MDALNNPREMPRVIIGRNLSAESQDQVNKMGSISAISKSIYREQKKKRTIIKMNNLRDIDMKVVEEILAPDGEKLLCHDTGYDEEDGSRALVFSTPSMLELLVKCEIIGVDGTFRVSFSFKKTLLIIRPNRITLVKSGLFMEKLEINLCHWS